jgi:hypothetical protein
MCQLCLFLGAYNQRCGSGSGTLRPGRIRIRNNWGPDPDLAFFDFFDRRICITVANFPSKWSKSSLLFDYIGTGYRYIFLRKCYKCLESLAAVNFVHLKIVTYLVGLV